MTSTDSTLRTSERYLDYVGCPCGCNLFRIAIPKNTRAVSDVRFICNECDSIWVNKSIEAQSRPANMGNKKNQ